MAIKIGVQLYSVRRDLKNDFYGTLKYVKELGYDGVEFAGLYGYSSEEIKEMLASLDLEPISAHVGFEEMIASDSVIETYAKIGCKYIAIPYLERHFRPGKEDFDEFIEGTRRLSKVAKENGITLMYHNHNFEFKKIDDMYGLDLIYKLLSKDELACEIDTCWVNIAGEDPCEYLLKYSGRCPIVHFKDFFFKRYDFEDEGIPTGAIFNMLDKKDQYRFEFRSVGSGVQDIAKLLETSSEIGAKWIIVEQDEPSIGQTAKEAIKSSINYLRALEQA